MVRNVKKYVLRLVRIIGSRLYSASLIIKEAIFSQDFLDYF
jgi:hypothetical protein